MRFRDYKEFGQGMGSHVFNRGNGKMDIFRDTQDYENFLKRLRIVLGKSQGRSMRVRSFDQGEFSLLTYCLMPNHFHLQIVQNKDIPISKAITSLCTSYSMYFNRRYQRVGHVFQNKFMAVPVNSERQMIALSAYIHQNPKVGGLVTELQDWPYSSYHAYVRKSAESLCDKESITDHFRGPDDYQDFVEHRFMDIQEQKKISQLFAN